MRNQPRDDGTSPLSEHERRVLDEMESDLDGLFDQIADPGVPIPTQLLALLPAILGLTITTAALILGVSDNWVMSRALAIGGLGLLVASANLIFDRRQGARRTRWE